MVEKNEEFYKYGRKHKIHLENEKRAERTNFNAIKKMGFLDDCKQLLVVGCPNTFFIDNCKEIGIDAKGVDIDSSVTDAKTVFSADMENSDMPRFDKNQFDVVYSKGLIQHLNKPPANFMKAVHRVLKPDGYFVMFVRNEKSIPNILTEWDNYKHKSTWTPISLKRMMQDFGFEIVYMNPRFNFSKARGLLTRMPFKWKLGSTIFVVGKKK